MCHILLSFYFHIHSRALHACLLYMFFFLYGVLRHTLPSPWLSTPAPQTPRPQIPALQHAHGSKGRIQYHSLHCFSKQTIFCPRAALSLGATSGPRQVLLASARASTGKTGTTVLTYRKTWRELSVSEGWLRRSAERLRVNQFNCPSSLQGEATTTPILTRICTSIPFL
jgi:hypothetical protein